MKFVYLTAVSITLATIVVLGHTKNLYARSMCVSANTSSLDDAVDSSLAENTAYNFLEAVIDRSIN
ncbi:hypothetical protein [Mastigocladopsis repens]|uniref:hypothetical protein n=1 Tax=Mastigocladopsis repens TaxID=221287 RepID=UPI001E64B843|nr:hypothetical protein [Mastigocladopsis repens]